MLIILPGWMHDATQWHEVSALLRARNIEHVVLDIPGFGTVPPDPTICDMKTLSQWCKSQIETIQASSASPVTLFGHSCGGRIALKLVADGLAVKHLILCGSPNLYRPDRKTKIIKLLAALAGPIKRLIPERIRVRFRSADYDLARGGPMQALYTDVVQNDQAALLRLITTKTHLLWGANDTAAPVKIGEELVQRLPYATLEVIPGVGHNIHHEKPQLLAAKIANYVTS